MPLQALTDMRTFLELSAAATLFLAVGAVISFLAGVPTWFLWNWLVPGIFGLREIGLIEAVGLNWLFSLLLTSGLALHLRDGGRQ